MSHFSIAFIGRLYKIPQENVFLLIQIFKPQSMNYDPLFPILMLPWVSLFGKWTKKAFPDRKVEVFCVAIQVTFTFTPSL